MVNIPKKMMSSSDGLRPIPVLGMGTTTMIEGNNDEVKLAIIKAIKIGYRHFDSAAIYQTEKPLGEAITEAVKLGLIESREVLGFDNQLTINTTSTQRI
ncbi:D-galacturonate reductase-like protein [Tanacetum coccineum]